MNPMKKYRIYLLTAVLAVVGLGGWWWQSHSTQNAAPDAASASGSGAGGSNRRGSASGMGNRTQPVSVGVVRKQDVRVMVSAIGNVTALNTAAVHSRVDSLLQKVLFTEGQQVKAGQVLAQLDPATFQVALDSANAMLARDAAQLKIAQVDLARYKTLLAQDSIQSQQVDAQDALVKQLSGTVKADQATVDNAKLQLGWCQITAPISGRLGLRLVDTGNMIHAADATGLVSITQTQPIAATFAVPEANLSQIIRQIKAKVPLMVEAWDREQKNRLAVGRILATDNAVDPTTGTIKMKASFANSDDGLFPNQFINISLQVDTIKDAIVVPTNAIQRGSQGTFVYVVGADSSVSVRKIKMGITDKDVISVDAVDTPLTVGNQVVIDGADRLRDGAKVEIIVPQKQGAWSGKRGGKAGTSNGAASAPAAPSSASTHAAPVASTAQAPSGDRPRWMDFVPPEALAKMSQEQKDKISAMSQDDRRDYIRKLRQQQ